MNSINCASCGAQIPADDLTCPKCQTAIATKSALLTSPRPRRILSRRRLISIAMLIGLECVVFWYWRTQNPEQSSTQSSGLVATNGPAQKIVREYTHLSEGQSAFYAFSLTDNGKVRIEVSATPQPVDVMLMTDENANKFRASQGKLITGQYAYRRSMSAENTVQMDKTEILPPGNWVVVIVRPHADIFFKKDTAATTVLTIY